MKDKISVMVVTYNSEYTIEETLNSVLLQSYGAENIELIITDDCSKDNTVSIIKKWSVYNKNKFYRVVLIENSVNKGVSENCNIGWK
ncbi:glycosyltransferase family 2 protein, partial [Escherichia coli]